MGTDLGSWLDFAGKGARAARAYASYFHHRD